MGKRSYYLQLPEELVPQALFDQPVRSRRVNITFESESGHNYRIQVVDDPRVKLINLDRSIGQVADDLEDMIAECLSVRAQLGATALHMGLELEIPSKINGKTWGELADKIHHRLHEIFNAVTCSSETSDTTKGN